MHYSFIEWVGACDGKTRTAYASTGVVRTGVSDDD